MYDNLLRDKSKQLAELYSYSRAEHFILLAVQIKTILIVYAL